MHGSAPKYAGKDVINPTAMIFSAVLMLRYLGLFEQAAAIEHAVFVTLEAGTLTGDVVGYDRGSTTSAYTEAIIANLGKKTETYTVREVAPLHLPELSSDPDYVKPDRAKRRRPRRVRGVPAHRRGARRLAHRARHTARAWS